MAEAPRPRMWPPTDLRWALIEKALEREKHPEPVPQFSWNTARDHLQAEKVNDQELNDARAREKCMFMNSLGLVRKDLVPTIRDLMDSKPGRRLRQRKPLSPFPELHSRAADQSLSPCNPGNMKEAIRDSAAGLEKKTSAKAKDVQSGLRQRDGGTRSKGVKRDAATAFSEETSQSEKTGDRVSPPSKRRTRAAGEMAQAEEKNHSGPACKAKLRRTSVQEESDEVKGRNARSREARRLMEMGKQEGVTRAGGTQVVQQMQPASIDSRHENMKEHVDLVPADTQFSDPTSLQRGKRQRRRPSKLLDSDFVFDFVTPAEATMSGVKTTECSVGTSLRRSVSPA